MTHQTQAADTVPPLEDLYTLEDFAQKHPRIAPMPTLRWQARHRDSNGFAACFVKQGKKLLIYKSRYERCLAGSAA